MAAQHITDRRDPDKPRVALIRQGDRPRLNGRLAALLQEAFPEYAVDDLDVWALVRRRRLTFLACVVGGALEHFGGLVQRRTTLKKATLTSAPFARAVGRAVAREVRPATHAFTFQSQSLFPAAVAGVPHFVYTDHAHLTNLTYTAFDARQLESRRFLARERDIYRSAARVFVRSDNVKRTLESAYGIAPERVVSVGVGPNVPVPDADGGRCWHGGRIAFVGVDWNRKGGPALLEAFRRVREKHPGARLEIVGCRPPIGEQAGVTVHGRLPPDDVTAVLTESDVFCLPTRAEPFGVAFIEAMHAGLAVVGTNIGAIPDFVRDGETGALVEPDDVDALATVLSAMLADPDGTRAMGAAGRALAGRRYRWDAVMRRIRTEILAAIGGDAPPAGAHRMPPLRVAAMVVGLRADGGAEALLRTLLQEVQSRTCDVTVFTMRQIDAEDRRSVEALGARVVEHPAKRLVSPRRFARLLAELRRGDFDVIHTNLTGANLLGLMCGALLRTPVLVTLHSTRSSGDGHWYHGRLERYLIRHHATRVIAVGDETATARSAILGPDVDIHVLPNAVTASRPTSPATRQQLRCQIMRDPAAPLFITVGRLVPAKGHEHLLEAFNRAVRELGTAELALAGSGRRREELSALAVELGIADRVHFLGRRTDARALIAAADVFVLSSLWEGLPVALLEAMEAGAPIVATDVGDVADVLRGTPARVVPPGDPTALAGAMVATWRDVAAGRDLGSAGRAIVASRYSASRWAERVVEHYRAALASATPDVT